MLFIRIICAHKEKVVILQQIMYNMLLFMQIDWDLAIKIATIASPIVGVIAIIVALCIARSSAKHAQRQIDVFMAAQAPDMLVALEKYEKLLEGLKADIAKKEQMLNIVNPFFGKGTPIEDVEYREKRKKQIAELEDLKNQQKKTETQIQLIKSFLEGE